MKVDDEVTNLQQDLYDLIGKMDAGRLPFVKTAMEHIVAGRVYEPNAVLLPELDNIEINEEGVVEGQIMGYVATTFQKKHKILM